MAEHVDVIVRAAGSLEAALGEVIRDFEAATGIPVSSRFGPSGVLRANIENGEPVHVFASADMAHPQKLHTLGRAGPVRRFAGNALCALVQPELCVESATILDALLDPGVRLGISTPGADPSGDYAWQMFEKAEALRLGAFRRLENKAEALTGTIDAPYPPEYRTRYGWIMAERKTDVFLTYVSNAILTKRQFPELQIVALPEPLHVGASYGLTLIDGAPASAGQLIEHILSPFGQGVFAAYGFEDG
jgi:molybdate transport system substrate-binding protein